MVSLWKTLRVFVTVVAVESIFWTLSRMMNTGGHMLSCAAQRRNSFLSLHETTCSVTLWIHDHLMVLGFVFSYLWMISFFLKWQKFCGLDYYCWKPFTMVYVWHSWCVVKFCWNLQYIYIIIPLNHHYQIISAPTPSTRCVLLPVVIQMLVLLYFPHISISILLILNFNDLIGTLPFIQIHLKCSRLDRGWFGCSVFWWNPACWGENRGWWFGDTEWVQNRKERRR